MGEVYRIPFTGEGITGSQAVAEYDRYAGLYMRPEYRYFARKILNRDFKNGRVLDIGTGSGRLILELAKKVESGSQFVGLDISTDMLAIARQKVAESGANDRLNLVQSTGSALPFANESFDLVISYASFHLWQKPEIVLDEIMRVLKTNGRVIIRDNRRVAGQWYWEIFIRILGFFMSHKRYLNWRKVILASYSLSEVQSILKNTRVKNYRLGTDFVKFDLCIEAIKE